MVFVVLIWEWNDNFVEENHGSLIVATRFLAALSPSFVQVSGVEIGGLRNRMPRMPVQGWGLFIFLGISWYQASFKHCSQHPSYSLIHTIAQLKRVVKPLMFGSCWSCGWFQGMGISCWFPDMGSCLEHSRTKETLPWRVNIRTVTCLCGGLNFVSFLLGCKK